jgi:hypothetical protein
MDLILHFVQDDGRPKNAATTSVGLIRQRFRIGEHFLQRRTVEIADVDDGRDGARVGDVGCGISVEEHQVGPKDSFIRESLSHLGRVQRGPPYVTRSSTR